MEYSTEQEAFWAGSFTSGYIERNSGAALLASNLHFFSNALRRAIVIKSCVELGANIGMNLSAIKLLYPGISLTGVEISEEACRKLAEVIGNENVLCQSLYESNVAPADLSFTKGVLIHQHPNKLPEAYGRLYSASCRYILVAEYYSPHPLTIPYHGHDDRLFKRDFAGEMLERFSDLDLIDYGFAYRRDNAFPQDDINWFLMEKRAWASNSN